jgi:hypothetical protein
MRPSISLNSEEYSTEKSPNFFASASIDESPFNEAEWAKASFGPTSDDLNTKRLAFHSGPCWLKLLVVDRVAGSIIGKGGKVITEIEHSCNCIMKLSPGHTFFPGTQERIVVIAGSMEGLSEAVGIILEKIRLFVFAELRNRNLSLRCPAPNDESYVDLTIRAVVPNSAVSCIIGRGGEVVREINRSTGAIIRIGDRMPVVHERIVQVTGSSEQCHAAMCEVLSRIQSDKNLREHLNVVYTKTASMATSLSVAPQLETVHTPPSASIQQVQTPSGSLPMNAFGELTSPNMYAQPCSISLTLPAGAVAQSTLRRIEAQTGAVMRFRHSSGTIQITGVFGAVHTAHILLLKETSDFSASLVTPSTEYPNTATPSPTAARRFEDL